MMQITEAIKEMKSQKKRNFVQTIDLAINLKELDMKKPENTFTEEVVLPAGRGKEISVGVIGNMLSSKMTDKAIAISESELGKMEKNMKEFKKVEQKCDFLIAEAPLMLKIGKSFGRVLGPKGKMPKPVPPQMDPVPLMNRLKNTVKLSLRNTPVIHCAIGTESMDDKTIIENFNTVMQALEKKLPKGKHNIKSIYVKTTMSGVIRVKY